MNDLNTTTCKRDTVVYPDGTTLKRIPYKNRFVRPQDTKHRCHDCGVALGGIHHWGCDMEHCPRCGNPLFFCACFDLSQEHPAKQSVAIGEYDLPYVAIRHEGEYFRVPLVELMRTGQIVLKTCTGQEIPLNAFFLGNKVITQDKHGHVDLSNDAYGLPEKLEAVGFQDLWETEILKEFQFSTRFEQIVTEDYEPSESI
jgi:hypothetical protein